MSIARHAPLLVALPLLVACNRGTPPSGGAAPDGGTSQVSAVGSILAPAIPAPSDGPRLGELDPARLPDRYRKNPALALVETYALSIIGELSKDREESARTVVKASFGGGDDWRETFRTRMRWPKEVDDNIRDNWKGYQLAATAAGAHADPREFARRFGDEATGQAGGDGH